MTWHPDLVDVHRRLVIEADSHELHTGKDAHARDCVRYTALTVAGWLVLRLTWDQVMHSPAYVRSVLADLVAVVADSSPAA
jgi:very-short-patch-repair endonuclease